MNCPDCGSAIPDSAAACANCGTSLADADQPTVVHAGRTPTPDPTPSTAPTTLGSSGSNLAEWRRRSTESQMLPPGFEIGGRYEVVRFLGRGGMGSVYQVLDRELERDVALKLISPELEAKPGIIDRFKREIQLSSRVTHRNVLRVYDLGESGGVKFLTMQFVEGEDLSDYLQRTGALPPEKATDLFRQICNGLAAAHEQGVIHRDIKPQNIMIDRQGRAYVTDFGLARTEDQFSLTASGAVLGTPNYMSPEQVKGQPVDARSDIYALGILLFQMLTRSVPYRGSSMYEVMMQRVQHPAPDVRELQPDAPESLSRIIKRCLAIDPEERYQSVTAILEDLDGRPASRRAGPQWQLPAIAALVVLILVGTAGVMWWRHGAAASAARAAAQKPVTVLIADLENRTGDPIFDKTLEPVLSIALEGARFINAYDRGQARKIADQLKPGTPSLDEPLARLVGLREGIDVVIGGAISREGDGYKLAARAIQPATGKVIGQAEESAGSREKVLSAASDLAIDLRKTLGDVSTPAESETFTASSLAAAQKYAAAQELQFAGHYEQALAAYGEAARLDPSMGRAYAGMAVMHANLGDRDEAEKDYKLAMSHIDRMTDREKYRTRGGYYLFVRNDQKAVEEFSALARQYPGDTAAMNNLALARFYRLDMRGAMEAGRRPVQLNPRNVLYRNNLALYADYAGDFATAAEQARRVLQINPEFVKAYVALALAQVGGGNLTDAEATYRRLDPVSTRGASLAATGLADLALYSGDAPRAEAILRKAIAADEAAKNQAAAARKRTMLAEALLAEGKRQEALQTARSATAAISNENVLYSAARVDIAAGDFAAADTLAAALRTRVEPEPQLYAVLIDGERLLAQGKPRDALTVLDQAQRLSDSWMGRLLRARAYRDAGAFTEADSELDTATKRKGEALAVLLDDVPTARLLPLLDYESGRVREGLGSPAARAAFEAFLRTKSAATNDPLVADAKARLK